MAVIHFFKALHTVHWTFLQVLITTSVTTSVVIIKLFNCGAQHPTRSLLRFYLSREFNHRDCTKRPQTSRNVGMKHLDIQRAFFFSGHHQCYEKRRLLIYFGDTNATHAGYDSVMGQLGSSWNQQSLFRWKHNGFTLARLFQELQQDSFLRENLSSILLFFKTEIGISVWNFPLQYNYRVTYRSPFDSITATVVSAVR